jgi:AraC-like DNA-binding protein
MDDQTKARGTRKARENARRSAEQEAERFERAMAYCRENFRTAHLADAAAHVGMSVFHFCRWFGMMAGRSFKTVITEMQIEHARALLLAGVRAPEVATRCGFAHQSHMTQRFGMTQGLTPMRWLRAAQRSGSAEVPPPLGKPPPQPRAEAA